MTHRWKRAGRSVALAALVVTGMVACGTGVREPEIRLDGVRLGSLGLDGGTLHVRLHVTNPNRFGIEAVEVTYELELLERSGEDERWRMLAAGSFTDGIRVAAGDSAAVEIPVRFGYREAGVALLAVLDRGVLDYRLTGTVSVHRPVRRVLPYRHLGSVSVAAET